MMNMIRRQIISLITMLLVSISLYAAEPIPGCGGSVVSGCVGECGAPFFASHIVIDDDVINSDKENKATFCLYTTENNLCPNTGAHFELFKNGVVHASGDLTELDLGIIKGNIGDEIMVNVTLVDKDDPIVCVTLGKTRFELGYRNTKHPK